MVLFQIALNPAEVLGPDFFTFLLPWILTFTLTYALLIKVDLFGTKNKPISLALGFVFAFFVTASAGPQLAAYLTTLFGNASMFLIGIIVIAMLMAVTNPGKEFSKIGGSGLFWAIVVIAGLLFFGSGGSIPGLNIDDQSMTLLFWGIIVIAAIYYVYSHKEEATETNGAPRANGGTE